MTVKQKLATVLALYAAWAIFVIFLMIGWVMNLISLFDLWSGELTNEFIIRLVGVPVAPIGAIAGWF